MGEKMTLQEALDRSEKLLKSIDWDAYYGYSCEITDLFSGDLEGCLLRYVGINLAVFYFSLFLSIFSILAIGVYYIKSKKTFRK